MTQEWFESWFDSPYYHILYKKRDDTEAKAFIDALLDYLKPNKNARMLDLACGKGRFSRYLANKGYDVTGTDLSENSIEYARQYEEDTLSFFTQDMRKPFRINYFDYTFSFFTSFGYFETEKEDLSSLNSVALGLKKGGIYVLDFFNSNYVIDNLVSHEIKELDGIQFEIKKSINETHVIKDISFTDNGSKHHYQEKVRLFFLAEFRVLFEQAGLELIQFFGDYQLTEFDDYKSPRLIMILRKI